MLAQNDEFQSLRPKVRADAIVRHYGNEIVAWSPISRQPTSLDAVGALLYQFFDGTASVAELVADVHDVIGVPPTVATNQVRRVVEQLDRSGLLLSSTASDPMVGELDLFPAPLNP